MSSGAAAVGGDAISGSDCRAALGDRVVSFTFSDEEDNDGDVGGGISSEAMAGIEAGCVSFME